MSIHNILFGVQKLDPWSKWLALLKHESCNRFQYSLLLGLIRVRHIKLLDRVLITFYNPRLNIVKHSCCLELMYSMFNIHSKFVLHLDPLPKCEYFCKTLGAINMLIQPIDSFIYFTLYYCRKI